VADPGWRVSFAADEHLDAPAAFSVLRPHREVVLSYRPSHAPSDIIACHEAAHLFLSEVSRWVRHCFQELPEPARRLAEKGLEDALELAADDIARAFSRAYGEDDG